jgi:hypothetical protein
MHRSLAMWLMLSTLAGHKRYAHITALRGDGVPLRGPDHPVLS